MRVGAFSDEGLGWASYSAPLVTFPAESAELALPGKPVIITEFDAREDVLLIILEGNGEEARIETRPTRDRRGTDVPLNGLRVAIVTTCPNLPASDIAQIRL